MCTSALARVHTHTHTHTQSHTHTHTHARAQTLGLTTLQVVSLLAQAPLTPGGLLQYVPFVPMAASMIYSMYDADSMKLRMQVGWLVGWQLGSAGVVVG